jgi:DNA-binding LacI/PurR family transcriptional regulator
MESETHMDARIAVISRTFGSKFQGLVYAHLRRSLPQGYTIDECLMPEELPEDAQQQPRLMKLLEGPSKPVALISLCVVPAVASVAAFAEAGIPFILVDGQVPGASTVASDNLKGGYLAGQHLIQQGRRTLALIFGGPRARNDYNAEQRMRGFENALREAGVALTPANIVDAPDYSRKDGSDAAAKLLRPGHKLDGLFCAAGDACAIGFLGEARKMGVKIPDQIAVVGYDDSPLAGICDPPLTTVRQPMELMAQEAVRLATAERAALLRKPAVRLLEPTLVVRSSA